MELATTTLTVLRGTTTNGYGSETNVGTPLYTGIPAALVESARQVFDRASQRSQTVRTTTAIVPSWADILESDTLLDETTGNYFMIESVTAQPTLGPPGGKQLILRSRSGVTVTSDQPQG